VSDCPFDLRKLYREGRVIPFIGAGASMSVSWGPETRPKRGPSWREMVDQAVRILGIEKPDLLRIRGTELQILEYFQIMKGGWAEISNWLSIELSSATDDDIVRSPIYQQLAELDRCHIFYTTNYDNFIERALRHSGREAHVVSSERNISHDRTKAEVVKFHGDFSSPDRMVFSESHFLDRMALESPMDLKFRADMLGRAVLFVGYGFGDPNVNYIFYLVNKILAALPDSYSGRRAYIILSDPSEFERRLFNARNIEVIAVDSADRSTNVANVLQSMRN
jgi:hypothetical protein